MYLGHYLAWVCAGIMGAAVAHLLNQPLSKLDAGDVAYQALGVAGAIAVVLAGWTTSNPTLYRAGLAPQSLTPGWPRWLVTLAAGIATTILACSPFVFQWLLQFVALYGILLMPVGAVVVAEHWLFPRLGWRRFWATRDGHAANWPALISWVTAIALSFYLYAADLVHEFFLAVPIWIFTSCLYLVLAYLFGAARRDTSSAEEEPAFYAGHSNEALFDSQNRAGKSSALVLWVSGLTALVTLIGCLVLPIRVFLKGAEGHSGLFQSFHQWLVWLSLAHLASAAVWVMRWDRRKATQ